MPSDDEYLAAARSRADAYTAALHALVNGAGTKAERAAALNEAVTLILLDPDN